MKPFRKFTLFLVAMAALPILVWAQSAGNPPPDPPAALEETPARVAAPEAPPALGPAIPGDDAAIEQPEVEASAVEALQQAPAPESEQTTEKVEEVEKTEKTGKIRVRRNEVVGIGQDVHIKAGEHVGNAVVIFGNLIVDGVVDNEVVVIGGRVKINGPVGRVVLVLSNGELGPDASIRGDAVAVGGRLSNPHGVKIGGSTVSIEQHFPHFGAGLEWFRQGLILGRPMVPGMHMTWIVAGAFLAFYLFIALIFRRAVNATAASLENRPGGTLLAALLFLPAFPLFILLLLVTVIGVFLVPFVMIGLFFAALFGKVAFLAFVGRALLRPAGAQIAGVAVLTTLVGGIVVTLLYGVWYLGFALWALTTWIGFGMVIIAIMTALQREKPKPAPQVPSGQTPASASPAAGAAAPALLASPDKSGASRAAPTQSGLSAAVASGIAGEPSQAAATAEAAGIASGPAVAQLCWPAEQPPLPPVQASIPAMASPTSAAGFERANFGIRLAAILIDTIIIGALVGALGGKWAVALFMGLYCGLMWFYRGTTVGGIICGLKVVRLDGRPMDGPTAVVRTLGAFLSLICIGIGFLWVIWDPEKQTWHDKIAGTTVIRVPKGMSLV